MGNRVASSLQKQADSAFAMTAAAIELSDDLEWRKAGQTEFCIPSRVVLHVLETLDFYLDSRPAAFEWGRRGDWLDSPVNDLPDRTHMRAYLEEVRGKAARWLADSRELDIPDTVFNTDFAAPVERLVYGLRHLQHHLGQLSLEYQLRGLGELVWI